MMGGGQRVWFRLDLDNRIQDNDNNHDLPDYVIRMSLVAAVVVVGDVVIENLAPHEVPAREENKAGKTGESLFFRVAVWSVWVFLFWCVGVFGVFRKGQGPRGIRRGIRTGHVSIIRLGRSGMLDFAST
jgi:hypothetical protein